MIPIILSGGIGSRLWPLSRRSFPKQFSSVISDSSLFSQTIERVKGYADEYIVVCNQDHRFIAAEQLSGKNVKNASVLLEPTPKNTCAAIACAALYAMRDNHDPLMLALPSDHFISDPASFHSAVNAGVPAAENGFLVTFGVMPTSPNTGFGYISSGDCLPISEHAKRILSFTEKPSLSLAEKYLQAGSYYWNSGIFLFKASTLINEINKFHPEIVTHCANAIDNMVKDLGFYRIGTDDFSQCPSISIDKAVMENTDQGAVVPLNTPWNDLGIWESVWDISKKDDDQNVLRGDVECFDTSGSLIISTHRMVAALGMKDIVVIETPDAVLVAPKSRSQDVKNIVEQLSDGNRMEADTHRKILRPWGHFDSIDLGKRYQVKKIFVKPGARLSLQRHHHRSEHWVVVQGTAKVKIGNDTKLLTENQSIYVPIGEVHSLENPGIIPLELIEIQSGSYLGEDDIERLEDIYGRTPE